MEFSEWHSRGKPHLINCQSRVEVEKAEALTIIVMNYELSQLLQTRAVKHEPKESNYLQERELKKNNSEEEVSGES